MQKYRSLFFGFVMMGVACANPASLNLNDGSVIKGEVSPSSPTATEVVVSTEYGVIRVPVDKITPESRKAAGIGQPATTAQYEARITQLEARVMALEAENAKLRRAQTTGQSGAAGPPPVSRPSPTASEPTKESGLSYSRSSTGKRHNSRCRYYSSGGSCGPSDGVACKICGG